MTRKWNADEWTSSDDRVRGGKSQSYLAIADSGSFAVFNGNLDIKTLGGAGFASQRTVSDGASWDLSSYDGIEVVIKNSDAKQYTFNIKDELLPRDPNTGREQSTISYEFDFRVPPPSSRRHSKEYKLWIPWKQLSATYRGREKKDAPKLKTESIKRFGIMCRSFFGDQEGDFQIEIERISAVKQVPELLEESASLQSVEVGDAEKKALLSKGMDARQGDVEGGNVADGSLTRNTQLAPWSKLALATGAFILLTMAAHCISPTSSREVKNWLGSRNLP